MGSNPTADRFRPWGHFSQGWQRGCIIETESSGCHDSLAERSKAVAQGAIPKGRAFEPHSCHFKMLAQLRDYRERKPKSDEATMLVL